MSQPALASHLEVILQGDIAQTVRARQQALQHRASSVGGTFVLFGAGRLGKIVLAGLREAGLHPVAFADNNPALWNSLVDGLQVLSPQDAVTRYSQKAIFVITVYTSQPVWDQLLRLGVQPLSFAELGWTYPGSLLPHGNLEIPHTVITQAHDVRAALSVWGDENSRLEYVGQLAWHTSLQRSALPPHLPQHQIYFPDDIIKRAPAELFVDCGAFDGDTIQTFVDRQGSTFDRIVAIEPDPANIAALRERVAGMPVHVGSKITVLQNAVGATRQSVRFNAVGSAASAVGNGGLEVECAPLDELLAAYRPTYIKMDIEGAEFDAIQGAQRVIRQHAPVLAICLYHRIEHLWKIPLLIRSYCQDYKLLLRRYSDESWELVCYAVPESRMR